jgi:hypothetical protein
METPDRPRWIAGLVTTCLLLVCCAQGSAAVGADTLRLRQHVEYLADDERTGRGVGTIGLVAAGDYIAARFQELGLEPGGDDETYFQSFEATVGVEISGDNSLEQDGRRWTVDEDWRPYAFSQVGRESAGLVFVGYGITAPEYEWDDYADVDANGKVAVVLAMEPGQDDSTSAFEGTSVTPHSSLYSKAIYAREHGAVGMLIVVGPLTDEDDHLARLQQTGGRSSGILCAQILRSALAQVVPDFDLGAAQRDIETQRSPRSRDLEPSLTLAVELRRERTALRNVIGVLPGSDPHRAVVVGAHYDHLGMGGPGSLAPDAHEPHSGADDNASGTAALLELARCFSSAEAQPHQTLVFAAFSGEEIGLAGSEHYVDNPTFPLQFTSAMLNMDMVGRLRDDKLNVFGARSAEEFPELLESANARGPQFDLTAKGDGYGPSDQMAFYKKDVAVLHFFTGAHADYHKPSDDAHLVDYAGLARVTDYVGAVALALMQQELTFVDQAEPARDTGVGGFKSSLGTIPDYSQPEDLEGVLLSDVRAEGPAAKAGLQGGDLIVHIDDMVIRNIYDFMHVLNTHKPGEQIRIVVERDNERVTLDAVLGARK